MYLKIKPSAPYRPLSGARRKGQCDRACVTQLTFVSLYATILTYRATNEVVKSFVVQLLRFGLTPSGVGSVCALWNQKVLQSSRRKPSRRCTPFSITLISRTKHAYLKYLTLLEPPVKRKA